MSKNLKNFFQNLLRDSKFDFKSRLNKKFKDFCDSKNINLKQENESETLIQLGILFEDFFFKEIIKINKNLFYINFKKQDEFNSKLNENQNLKKEFLNSFKKQGYFQKNIDFEHLKKEFSSNLNDYENFENFRNDEILDANLHACLVCHERDKDSCRKGFSSLKKEINGLKNQHGCPLKMHISEAIYLKKNGFHLAALLIMMVNNPLCILTGHRICIDCNKACIFEASSIESIDVSSLESKILFDILEKIDFGPEIYYFFLIFNPIYEFFHQNIQNYKKKILVIGAGAAGISTLYNLFIRQDQFVELIDAGKIDFDHERFGKFLKYPLKNGARFLSFPQSKRKKNLGFSGFGGVIEYGITNRWNKNLIDLLLIFFKRFEKSKNFQMKGTVFFSNHSEYGLEKALFKDNFDLCIFATGSSKQKLMSNIKFNFLDHKQALKPENFFFAADFLIDYNLKNEKNLKNFFNLREPFEKNEQIFSLIILGFGLSAVDAASAFFMNFFNFLKKSNIFFDKDFEPEERLRIIKKFFFKIGIIYSKNLKESSAWQTNSHEVLRLFSLIPKDHINILENHKISQINQIKDFQTGKILYEIFFSNQSQSILTEKIFIANGFDQNEILFKENDLDQEKILKFFNHSKDNLIFEFSANKFISFIGDANPFFRGSVVKAIESGQKISEAFGSYKFSKESTQLQKQLQKKSIDSQIQSIQFHESFQLTHIVLSNNFHDSFEPGMFFRAWFSSKYPIHLTPIYIEKNKIHFLIKNKDYFFINPNSKASLLGPLGSCEKDLLIGHDAIHFFFLGSKFALYSKIPLFLKLKQKSIDFIVFSLINQSEPQNSSQINFFEKIIKKNNINFLEKSYIYNLLCQNQEKNINLIFDEVEEDEIKKILNLIDQNRHIKYNLFSKILRKFGCSMKGLCGKCFVFDKKTDSIKFECGESQIKKLNS